jgi:NADH:ubiquinone oxidoreductase subunit F (NADH-binding)
MTRHDSILLSDAPVHSLDVYLSQDGTLALRKALGIAPGEIIAEVKRSCLGGRGGAGFPTGMKWETVAQNREDAPISIMHSRVPRWRRTPIVATCRSSIRC